MRDRATGQAGRSGAAAEDLAVRFLERRGLRVLARNYRCRSGEIDVVCRDGRILVFVEVRLRRNPNCGGSGASITACKLHRLRAAAQHYLQAHLADNSPCRFDCVLLDDLSESALEWIRDAFA